jgi:hypothetical protein
MKTRLGERDETRKQSGEASPAVIGREVDPREVGHVRQEDHRRGAVGERDDEEERHERDTDMRQVQEIDTGQVLISHRYPTVTKSP